MSCCGATQFVSERAPDNSTSGVRVGDNLVQTDFVVPGMHCIGCIKNIEGSLSKLEFVERVRANLSLKRVSVTWREDKGDFVTIDQKLSDIGFEHSLFDIDADRNDDGKKIGRRLLSALGVAGFGAANIMLLSVSVWSGADGETTNLFHLLSGLIAVPVVFFSGQEFFRSAFSVLKVGRLNMDVPISLAVLLALSMSIFESLNGGSEAYFDAAVTLLFFLLIGRYLDHLMREKAREAVVSLNKIAPKKANLLLESGETETIAIDEIEQGQVLRLMAGERVPVDSQVIAGNSDLDCSLVTGENIPLSVKAGSQLDAGTLNLTGVIDIKVLRDARHSFLAEVARLMDAAEQGRGRFTRIADRMAKIYAPAVHILAGLALVGWMVATRGDWHTSIYVAISVLIITCPCALGLAVPVAHVVGAHRLFKQGIVIADGAGFERLEQVTRVIFDKTGTLTTGIPRIKSTDLRDRSDQQIAKSLGLRSNHPASKAVARYFSDLPSVDLVNLREVPGFGIEGEFNGKRARLGRADWVGEITRAKGKKRADGLSFAVEGEEISVFGLDESLREGAQAAINDLRSSGLAIELLSGDNEKPVALIADQLGITAISHNNTPHDKVSHIGELRDLGEKILMVGDGLNDAAALRAAHVSMAPSNACDVGRQAADFVLLRNNLASVPFALKLARRVGAIVRQNFALAIAYNMIAVPFAMAGMVTPLAAALAMSASSIVVVSNSMRLSRG